MERHGGTPDRRDFVYDDGCSDDDDDERFHGRFVVGGIVVPRSSGVVVDFTGCGSFLLQHRLEFEGWRNMVPITGLLYIRRQKGNTNNNDDDDLLLRVGVLPVNIALGCMSESLMMMELGSIHDGIVHYLSEDTHITYLPHAHHPYTLLIERSDGQRTIRITSQPR